MKTSSRSNARPVRRKFLVTLDFPAGSSDRDLTDYIRDAVRTWGVQKHPEDPLFAMWDRNVTVKRQR